MRNPVSQSYTEGGSFTENTDVKGCVNGFSEMGRKIVQYHRVTQSEGVSRRIQSEAMAIGMHRIAQRINSVRLPNSVKLCDYCI